MKMQQILQMLMEKHGDDAYTLQEKSGVPQPTTFRFLSGKHGDPRSSTVKKWAGAYGLSESQLRGDVPLPEELGIPTDRRVSIYNTEPGPNLRGEYPLISWVQAGDWMQIVDNFNPGDAESFFSSPKKCGPHTFLLRVRGPSMEPKYSDGELIYVDPGIQWEHGKNVVVKLVDDQEATFKNLVVEGNKMWLRPLNPEWPEQIIPLDESARIVGVVIGKYVPD